MPGSTEESPPIDLGSASFFADPYPTFAKLRQRHPVYWSEQWQRWVLTRYDDIIAVLRDTRRFSSNVMPRLGTPAEKIEMDPFLQAMPRWLFFLDPPQHGPARAPYVPPFTPSALKAMEPFIQRIVGDLLDRVAAAGSMDAIWDLAFPLPATVLAEMLCPPEDRARLVGLARGLSWASANATDRAARQGGIRAAAALELYFRELICERRESGPLLQRFLASIRERSVAGKSAAGASTGGITTPETAGEGAGGTADTPSIARGNSDEQDVIAQCLLMICAGIETTQHLLGNGLLALLSNPAQLQLFRDKAETLPNAVEELLRYDSPVQSVSRVARVDIDLHGQRIRKGDELILLIGAANRDPARFADPDRLDLARSDVPHLSFGYGNHYCLGATLARMEASIAFRTLLRRFPGLCLADKPIEWRTHDPALRGLRTLIIEFTV